MNNDLNNLKNLGNTSINWLNAVGVNSFDDLQQLGAVAAYTKVKQRGFKVSKVFLYALQGALTSIHWSELDDNQKEALVNEAESLLAEQAEA